MPSRRHVLPWVAVLAASPLHTLQAQTAAAPPADGPGEAASHVDSAARDILRALPQAQRRGSARMRFFGMAIYDASLWVAPGFVPARYAEHAFALALTYQRSLRGSAIAERSLDEMRRGGPIPPAQAQAWLDAMRAAFPDVRANDRLTGLHQPGVGARFWFNGQALAEVADTEFSARFFGIWLATHSSEPALRTALLGAP